MKKFLIHASLAGTLVLSSAAVHAWEVLGKVVRIKASWVPDYVLLQVDTAFSGCPASTWIKYVGDGVGQTDPKKNIQAAYAALLGALYTGKKVAVYGVSTCVAINLQPTNQ